MRVSKRVVAIVLAFVLVMAGCLPVASDAEAAAKPKLSKKTLKIQKGKSKTIKVKKAKGYKIKWSIKKKKIAKVTKKGKYGAKIKAKKKGNTTIYCRLTKKGKKKKTLKCKLNVYTKKKASATKKPTVSTNPTVNNTQNNNPTTTVKPLSDSIIENYSAIFPYMGTCVTPTQLNDADTLNFVKKHFNSFTLENEMKPDTVLRSSITRLTVDEAKELGYVIPENYEETAVPKLNFDPVDTALQTAYDNGLKMRAHTLVWHSQTPAWFFAANYRGSTATDADTMDARLEFYVRTVMKHVMEKEKEIAGKAGSLVYAWDVTNEYLHRLSQAWSLTWTSVYGDLGASPTYVKKAYQFAYDMLKQYGVQENVTLFYNDYDTYFGVQNTINLVNYINAGEEAKICGGIGMQSHVDIKRPTISEYIEALDAFLKTGLEVQITELDFTINFDTDEPSPSYAYEDEGETLEEQATFVSDFMKMVIYKQHTRNKTVSPKGITGVTLWGLYDSVSWRGQCQPLLFGTSITDKKSAFDSFLNASRGQ